MVEPEGASKNDHRFIVYSFSSMQPCHLCSEFLWGLLQQGYQCRGEQKQCLFRNCCLAICSFQIKCCGLWSYRTNAQLSVLLIWLEGEEQSLKLSIDLFIHPKIHPVLYSVIHLSIHLSTHPSSLILSHPSIYLSSYLPIHLVQWFSNFLGFFVSRPLINLLDGSRSSGKFTI